MNKDIDFSKLDWKPIEQPKTETTNKNIDFSKIDWKPIEQPKKEPSRDFNFEDYNPIKGIGEAGLSLGTGAIFGAPLGLGAGIGSLINRAFGSQEDPKEVMAKYAKMATYEPRSKIGKAIIDPIHKAGELVGKGTQAGGEYVASKLDSPVAGAITDAAGQVLAGILGAKALPKVIPTAQKGIETAKRGAELVAKPVTKPYDILAGKEVTKAKESAIEKIQQLMQKGMAKQTEYAKQIQDSAIQAEKSGDALMARAETLKRGAEKSGDILAVKDYQAQGQLAKAEYNKAINAEKAYRETQVQADKKDITDIVNKKQTAGIPLSLQNVIGKIDDVRKQKGHLPPIERELNNFEKSIVSRENKPLNYDQIEVTRRYFDDIANDIGTERFDAVVKDAAKDIANALRDDMRAYVGKPFDTYLENYRKNSENLKSLSEKLGKMMYETPESTLTVATEKIPGRIFSDVDTAREFQKVLESAQKKAPEQYTGEQTARNRVISMMEDFLKEKFRSSGKIGETGLAEIKSAELRPLLENLAPEVKNNFTRMFEQQARLLEKSKNLAEQGKLTKSQAESMRNESAKRIGDINDIKSTIDIANKKFNIKDGLSDALADYNSVLKKAKEAGILDDQAYKSALEYVYKTKEAARARENAINIMKAITAVAAVSGGWSVFNAIGQAGR